VNIEVGHDKTAAVDNFRPLAGRTEKIEILKQVSWSTERMLNMN
jgi:hypothetical protein